GLLVPPEPDAIAAAVDRLLSDRDLRSELGKAGRNRLEEEFTDQHFRTRLASILAGGNRGS
ncbi:MAG TPA: glycosyltransferase, partial [Actinomycetota bacterium]|nr:glycosyltransferase [Actinomycetota bacterium]